jgi:PEP-CTERM motif
MTSLKIRAVAAFLFAVLSVAAADASLIVTGDYRIIGYAYLLHNSMGDPHQDVTYVERPTFGESWSISIGPYGSLDSVITADSIEATLTAAHPEPDSYRFSYWPWAALAMEFEVTEPTYATWYTDGKDGHTFSTEFLVPGVTYNAEARVDAAQGNPYESAFLSIHLIPEPGTLTLLALGLALSCAWRRR